MNNNIIRVESDKCEGCNNCIRVCPVNRANESKKDGVRNIVSVNPDDCIHCGACIKACMHNVRYYVDDTERLINDLKGGKKIAVVIAPSIRTNFKDEYKKVIAFLKSIGATHVYDSSFGAEICTWGYLKYIEKTGKMGLISQPCPAIVNYIEKYQSESIEQLMPIHSPMSCAAIYLHTYDKISSDVAFLSPCIAKYDEVHNPDTPSYLQYSVTFKSLKRYIEYNRINLQEFNDEEFDDLGYGLGSIFPMPGGLKENVYYHLPGAWVSQCEGFTKVYKYISGYMDRVARGKELPALVDVLNCEYGCNIGTASTLTEERDIDEVNQIMNKEKSKVESQKAGILGRDYKLFKMFDKEIKLRDFVRNYTKNPMKEIDISDMDIRNTLKDMKKETYPEQNFNCQACGYESCREMAKSIIMGKNSRENCVMYKTKALQELKESMDHQTDGLIGLIAEQKGCITNTFNAIMDFVDKVKVGIEDSIAETQQISRIADQTRIVSFNAGVEAAKVGANGNGFSVVADEVGLLANESKKIADTTNEMSSNLLTLISEVIESTDNLKTELEEKDKNIENEIYRLNTRYEK